MRVQFHAKVVFFDCDIKCNKQEKTSYPDIVGNPSRIIYLQERRQVLGEEKVEVAQKKKQPASPLDGSNGSKLVQSERILEKKKDKAEAGKGK